MTAIVDRLVELTGMNRISWVPIYPENIGDLGTLSDHDESFMQSLTRPQGYLCDDEAYGFGLVVLKTLSPEDEIYEPALYVLGQRQEVEKERLQLLVDAISVYLTDVQLGRAPNLETSVDRAIEDATQNLETALHLAQQELNNQKQIINNQLVIINKLTDASLLQIQDWTRENSKASSVGIPLTVETLQQVSRHLFPETATADFNGAYSDERCAKAIQQLTQDLNRNQAL